MFKSSKLSGVVSHSLLGFALLACSSSGEGDADTPPAPGAFTPAQPSTEVPGNVASGAPAEPSVAPSGSEVTGEQQLGSGAEITNMGASAGSEASGSANEVASGGAGGSEASNGGAGGSGGTDAASSGTGGEASPGAGGAAPAALTPITIWLAGDSTVANGLTPCPVGWGKLFDPHFNDLVSVVNSAVGGRSVRTWLFNVQTTMDASGECVLARDASGAPTLQPRWQAMLDGMKAGDYLFIQFGINDSSATCDRHVGLEAFKDSYAMMALAAKERGTQPIFVTPVSSIACNGATARGSRGGFVTATQEVGAELDVPVIDLHARSVALFNQHGFCPVAGGDVSAATTGPVGDFFCDDHTHFDTPGAIEISDLVVQALREQNIPLAAYLK